MWHVQVPRPGIEAMSQSQIVPQLQPCWILNPLHHKGASSKYFMKAQNYVLFLVFSKTPSSGISCRYRQKVSVTCWAKSSNNVYKGGFVWYHFVILIIDHTRKCSIWPRFWTIGNIFMQVLFLGFSFAVSSVKFVADSPDLSPRLCWHSCWVEDTHAGLAMHGGEGLLWGQLPISSPRLSRQTIVEFPASLPLTLTCDLPEIYKLDSFRYCPRWILNPSLATRWSYAHNSIGKGQQKGKVLWSETQAVWGEGGLVSRERPQDSAQSWQLLKGNMGEGSQRIIKVGGWILHHSPLTAAWLSLSSDVILAVWSASGIP